MKKNVFSSIAIGFIEGLFSFVTLILSILWVFKDGLWHTYSSTFEKIFDNAVTYFLLFLPLIIFIVISIIQYKVIKKKNQKHNFKYQLLYSFIIAITAIAIFSLVLYLFRLLF